MKPDLTDLEKARKEVVLLRKICTVSTTAALILAGIVVVEIYKAREQIAQHRSIRTVLEETPGAAEQARILDEAIDELGFAISGFDDDDWREVVPKVKDAADGLASIIYRDDPPGSDWKSAYDARKEAEREYERKAEGRPRP